MEKRKEYAGKYPQQKSNVVVTNKINFNYTELKSNVAYARMKEVECPNLSHNIQLIVFG